MKSSTSGALLFGNGTGSMFWALAPASKGPRWETWSVIPEGQIAFLLPVDAPIEWKLAKESGRVSSGNFAVLDTRMGEASIGFGQGDRAIVVGMRHGLLSSMLKPFRPGMAEPLRSLIFGPTSTARLRIRPEIATDLASGFLDPQVTGPGLAFWYESQFKALLALLCFVSADQDEEFFCTRQKRLAGERVAKAKAWLESRLDEPFDLQRLAREVACSPSYLSRTFSAAAGMTLSQFVRQRRVEKAAELLVTGKYNVSEVAIEVGYQSLSHFSKAFHQVKGCLPSKYEAA
ncbi:MAG: helix-turn-helix transcriptional regulator [Verrucomicrobiae bacterium]|nr:helix-turn-helix transcriptional regulator [Verrucomicrobiae bacterium]